MANSGTFDGQGRVVVVDGDEDSRQRLKDILQSEDNFIFAGEFSTGKEALAVMPSLHPDLAIVDIRLPDMEGIECLKSLTRSIPVLRVIIVSGNRDTNFFNRASDAGAVACLIKPVDAGQLIATLRIAIFHKSKINRSLKNQNTASIRDSAPTRRLALSPREQEVLSGLADGLLYKEISDKLPISFAAVHKYSHNLYKKLGVSNRSEAIRVWLAL
jgi:two-component system response regulator DevR